MAGPTSTALAVLVLAALQERSIPGRGLVSRVINNAVDIVPVDHMVGAVDLNAQLHRVDLDAVLADVDLDAALERVDVNALLDRIDIDRLAERIDVAAILDRVDINALLDRVDIDRLMDRIDVVKVVDRAGIADIVAESTGAVAGSVLDVARRQFVLVDTIADRLAYRVTGRDPASRPVAPALFSGDEVDESGRGQVTGHYAGPLTRLLAFSLDTFLVLTSFTLLTAGTLWLLQLFGIARVGPELPDWIGFVFLMLWALIYSIVGLALVGKTVGKGVLGLRVVSSDGSPLSGRRALLRTVTLPLSILLFGAGIFMALLGARRAALHDSIARTAEVYDWGDRPAEMPAPFTAWVARRDQELRETSQRAARPDEP